MMEDIQWRLTPTVESARKRLDPDEPVGAADLVRGVLEAYGHREEYTGGRFVSLQLEDTPPKQAAQEWLDEVQTLFDPARIQETTKSDRPPALHGRLLIIGLSLLEPELYRQIEDAGAFTALVDDLDYSLDEVLAERGRELLELVQEGSAPPDSVPTWSDDPVKDPRNDLLGRRGFARFCARRIAAIPPGSDAYAMHLYGPWGAGKSTLLNLLHVQLTAEHSSQQRWLVVDFNAWRNQHIRPPWWSLMESVFQGTKGALSWVDRLRERWWRLNTGRVQYLVGIAALAWILVLIVFPLLRARTAEEDLLNYLADTADSISKILALVATIWGAVLATSRSLLLGSARAAQSYTELTRDPMGEIKRRFETLIRRLERRHRRVAVFVDDLDRCQSSYVVELLEGIQTLFREAPVVFVVAADRRWLNACYEQVYEKLEPQVSEAGKSLGTLFLEKAFRFSTPLPGISAELKQRYWLYLLQVEPAEGEDDLAQAQEAARNAVSRARSEGQVRRLVDDSRERPFVEQRAIREEAAVRLAAPEIIERLEHALKRYAGLLEPNPRAMKRLVNAYSANRALAILSEVEIERHQLVLWTILSSRWPQLADFLAEHPDTVTKVGQRYITGVRDRELRGLFRDDDVIRVVQDRPEGEPEGRPEADPLADETVRQCARMRA